MVEIGHGRAPEWGPLAEDNWQLRWPESTRVFAKMRREDAQVASILKAITLPIRRATWQLDPNGCDEQIVQHVAGDLRMRVLGEPRDTPLGVNRGRVSWDTHLARALEALTFGHMFFEQVYAEGEDGRDHLVKLAPRLPGSITKIKVADDGGLEGIEQQTLKGQKKAPFIPVDRLVAYVHDPMDDSWTGTSILRPAYKHWRLRDELLRLEVTILDRNGMGIPVYTGSDLATNAGADLRKGEQIARAMRHGDTAGAAIPAGAKLEFKGVTGQLTQPREAIAYHDSMMARSVLAHFLNLEGKGGSYSLAETQSDLFVQSLQTVADWVADVSTQHIVQDLVELVFPDYRGPVPMIICDPIASKKELAPEALAQLVNSGMILPDADIEEDVRRRYQLPSKKPYEPVKEANTSEDSEPSRG